MLKIAKFSPADKINDVSILKLHNFFSSLIDCHKRSICKISDLSKVCLLQTSCATGSKLLHLFFEIYSSPIGIFNEKGSFLTVPSTSFFHHQFSTICINRKILGEVTSSNHRNSFPSLKDKTLSLKSSFCFSFLSKNWIIAC